MLYIKTSLHSSSGYTEGRETEKGKGKGGEEGKKWGRLSLSYSISFPYPRSWKRGGTEEKEKGGKRRVNNTLFRFKGLEKGKKRRGKRANDKSTPEVLSFTHPVIGEGDLEKKKRKRWWRLISSPLP